MCRLVALVVCAAGVTINAQTQTFKTQVDVVLVSVDVLVTRDGKPVHALTRDDFEVLEDGQVQQIDMLSEESAPLDVVLAFDMSGSVSGRDVEQLAAGARAMLARLRPQDGASLISFNDEVVEQVPLTDEVPRVERALLALKPEGGTSLIDATLAAMVTAHSRGRRSLVIVFSDGRDTASFLQEDAVLQLAGQLNTTVYAVSVDRESDGYLSKLIARTGGRTISAQSVEEVSRRFLDVFDEFRQRYYLTYAPKRPDASGWRKIEVRLKRSGLKAAAKPGYFRSPAAGNP